MYAILKLAMANVRTARMILVVLSVFSGQQVAAHEFLVTLRAVGMERQSILVSAMRGFFLATTERDGHPAEESNGHLGGLDVYILLEPINVADHFPELKNPPADRPDIVVVIGPQNAADMQLNTFGNEVLSMRPGIIASSNRWSMEDSDAPGNFAARYRSTYGLPADQWAADGYNAARRLDDAIRPLGGLNDLATLKRALLASADGTRW